MSLMWKTLEGFRDLVVKATKLAEENEFIKSLYLDTTQHRFLFKFYEAYSPGVIFASKATPLLGVSGWCWASDFAPEMSSYGLIRVWPSPVGREAEHMEQIIRAELGIARDEYSSHRDCLAVSGVENVYRGIQSVPAVGISARANSMQLSVQNQYSPWAEDDL